MIKIAYQSDNDCLGIRRWIGQDFLPSLANVFVMNGETMPLFHIAF